MPSLLIKNAAQVASPVPGVIRGVGLQSLRMDMNSSILIRDGVIEKIAPVSKMPDQPGIPVLDATGKAVIPGFVDSHTHLVFGGRREDEFARRCAGQSYREIARAGGGIMSTVYATRDASKEELIKQGLLHLDRAVQHGITTMEAKSGYGLNAETELKILEVIRELDRQHAVDLYPTFLGAHAFPPDSETEDYVQDVKDMLPEAAKLARFCDVFIETGYFEVAEALEILCMAREHGLRPRVHTNQFTNIGGVQAAVDIGAISADHLEVMSETDISMLAASDVCATMLPGVSLFLNIPYAPGRKMIDAGCIPVLATDFNPGSSMILNFPLVLSLACTQMGFSMPEALCAATQNGAVALGIEKLGCIEPGWGADLIVLDSDNFHNLVYFVGEPQIHTVIKKGEIIYTQPSS